MSRQRFFLKFWFLTFSVTFALTLILPSRFAAAVQVDEGGIAQSPDSCDGVRSLMTTDRTPHDLPAAGGVLSPNIAEAITLNADQYAAFHILNVARPENQASTLLTVGFSGLNANANLEVGLFRGLEPVSGDYRPVTAAQTQTFTVNQGGLHTLVVRRVNLSELGQTTSYTLTANFTGADQAVPTPIRDETTNATVQNVAFINGYELIPLPNTDTTLNIHADGATTVASRDGASSQIRYGQNGLLLGSWVDHVDLLGGDLAVTGEVVVNGEPQPRILYIQDFGHAVNLTDLNLGMITDADGSTLLTDWQTVKGVWLLRDCVGMKLQDGRTFVASLTPTDSETGAAIPITGQPALTRAVTFNGTLADFDIRVSAPTAAGTRSTTYTVDLSWNGVAADSEIRLHNGVLSAELLGGKRLDVQDTSISLFRRPGAVADTPAQENTPLEITARTHDAMLVVDWLNMNRLAFVDDTLHMGFTDARGEVIRDGADLLRFESLQDTVRIVAKPDAAGTSGAHSLWLGADMGYIEIATPPGQPSFDNRAIPGESGYFPRALNNLGGECYPTNTLLPEANCPPNGHINPANGNLWYSVTDLEAAGGWIDLTLTRSYNLLAREVDGAFGPGWSTAFALDYAVPYDETTRSRLIDPTHTTRVGLDLTWTPRGIVTFTTPSGSRHTFVSPAPPSASQPGYDGTATEAPLTAITMPGWTLSRANPQDNWTLRQSDDLTYTFDRAGRLLSYGYPKLARFITVTYDRAALHGQTEGAVAVITDDETQRRLELIYTADGRIARAIMRDMTLASAFPPQPGAPCSAENQCYETRYQYDENGQLIGVEYADGGRAAYTYDEGGRLLTHSDPRAPITPDMTYTYDDDGLIAEISTAFTDATGATTASVWRRFTVILTESERRFTVIEPTPTALADTSSLPEGISPDRTSTYVYALAEVPGPNTPTLPLLRQPGDGFTLKSRTGPLAGTGAGIDGEPQTYTWNNGLLTSINARGANENVGRNSITFAYRPDGQITELGQGVTGFTVRSYDVNGLPGRVSYGDLSEVQYNYDAQNRPIRVIDRQGADYIITWDAETGRPTKVLRNNDSATWIYTYNSLGLVTTENRSGNLVTYSYDGLGRLIAINDSLLGRYTLTYRLLDPEYAASLFDGVAESSVTPPYVAEVTLTDQGGTDNIARYDARGRLVETLIVFPRDAWTDQNVPELLRHTTWTYDHFDRPTAEIQWAGNNDISLVTSVTYDDRVQRLEPLPGQPNTAENTPVIKGYAVTTRDSVGRSQRYIYDALGRIREVVGDYGQRQRYDYAYDSVAVTANDVTLPKGMRIQQRDVLGELLYATTRYEFSERWQLREITRTTGTAPAQTTHIWSLATQGDPVRPAYNVLEARSIGIASLNWGLTDSADPRPTGATINPANTALAVPKHTTELDFLGRATTVTDGNGITSSVAYCPTTDGGQRVLLFQPVGTSSVQACQRNDYQFMMVYDAHGRLTQSVEADAERRLLRRNYTYTRDTLEWVVTATFGEGTTASRWTLRYNMAGDLIDVQDETGAERSYTYDTAGRLTSVNVDDLPEASYTFSYDPDTGLLERVIDGLDRGWTYQYDTRGLLLSQQQIETASATTYGYDAAGRMTSVISPLGNTTVYRYTDTDDPWRVTEIVDATGVVHRYAWDDTNNVLSYRDIRGRENRYHYDVLGALQLIEERGLDNASSRTSELRYNAAGELTDFMTNPNGSTPTQHFTLTRGTQPGAPLVIGESRAEDWSWALTFNADGLLTSITNPEGHALTASYDAMRRLSGIDAGAHDWSLAYPPNSQVLALSHRLNNRPVETAQVVFDALYRLTALNVVNPDGSVAADDVIETEYAYTAARDLSLTTIQRDGSDASEPTQRTYTFFPGDNTANPRAVTLTTQGLSQTGENVANNIDLNAPSGQTMTIIYNPENLIEEIRHATCVATDEADCIPNQAGGASFTTFTRFLYDAQGRPIRINDAERGLEVFTYDDVGNLISYQTINGRAFNYEYDARNRLKAITGPTGIKVMVNYNDLDQVIAVCRARAEEITDFSDCERIDAQPDIDVIVERYQYDSLGRLIEQRFKNAGQSTESAISHTYTGGLLTAWGSVEGDQVGRDYSDDALSLLTRLHYDDQLTDFYDLDYAVTLLGDTRLTSQQNTGGLPDITYSYDLFGRLARLVYGGTAFQLDYQANREGYTFTHATDGEGVGFALNNRGLLQALDYLVSGDTEADEAALLNFDYTAVLRATDILQIGIGTSDVSRSFIYELDRQGQTLSQATDFDLAGGADTASTAGTATPNAAAQSTATATEAALFVVNRFAANLAGQVNRQQVDGSPPGVLFAANSGGYVTVTGYDDNYRLTTIAITSKADGRPLYTMNFAYNAVGQRESESRRFEDDTQIDINYVYNVSSQLTQRTVEVIRPGQQTTALNGWPLFALLPLLWFSRLHRRTVYRVPRKILVIALGVALVGGVMLGSVALAQQNGGTLGRESFTFDYAYDSAGNLNRISFVPNGQPDAEPRECAAYSYDTANRLIEARTGRQIVRYAYDAQNRLMQLSTSLSSLSTSTSNANAAQTVQDESGVWNVVYAGDLPIAAYTDTDSITYYGRVSDHPAFFLGQDGDLTWLVSDGRDRILTALQEPDTDADSEDNAPALHPVLVLDPVGRPLTFAPPATLVAATPDGTPAGDPCQLSPIPDPSVESVLGISQPQYAFDSMIWDPNTNLYFSGGRAYLPEIGRFLQRSIDGPDAFGSVYDFARRPDIPVQRAARSVLVDGLGLLDEALATIHRADALNPSAVIASYAPAPQGLDSATDTATVWTDALGQRAPNQASLARLQALPTWLRSSYNLPEPQLDAFAGNVGLSLANAPGQGGLGSYAPNPTTPSSFPTREWLPSAPFTLDDLTTAVTAASQPSFARVNSYQSLAWKPLTGLASRGFAWDVPLPRLDGSDTPSAVLDWLPRPLTHPTAPQVMDTLNLVQAIKALPFETGYDWLLTLLKNALPTLPDLPPLTESDWRDGWFDDDTFGLRKALAPRYDVPTAPDVPVYGLFPNLDWLRGE